MTARFLRQEFFEFKPCFKVFLATNHKPEIRGTDDAIWSRPILIPFHQKFWKVDDPDRPAGAPVQDPMLEDKLQEELPGILSWIVEGCVQWQNVGLRTPKDWVMATQSYRSEMDTLGAFFDECCDMGEIFSVNSAELYDTYVAWTDANGMHPFSSINFGKELTKKGFGAKKGTGGVRMRTGIGLKARTSMDFRK